jgi:hypothetical protein
MKSYLPMPFNLKHRMQLILGLIAMLLGIAQPVAAQNGNAEQESGWEGEISASATYANRSRELLDDANRSNIATRAEISYKGSTDLTRYRVEAHIGASDYRGDNRDIRLNWGGRAELGQKIAKDITIEASAAHSANIVSLESLNVDQSRIGGALTIEPGKHLFEVHTGYRWRNYDDGAQGSGKGMEIGARYRHRFASYHWAAFGISHDRIKSSDQRRSYRRTSLNADYSVPIAPKLRLVAGIDHRRWVYLGRPIGNVAGAANRRDRLIQIETGLSYGRAKGAFARATIGYDFYKSDDIRFSGNGVRARLGIGYRF